MRRPSFQFYPADWRNNANLRRCSPAARGIWVDVLCVLHDSDEYGLVRWPLADLANSANAPMKLVKELVEKRVLKGNDKAVSEAFIYTPRSGRKDGDPITLVATQVGPVWYSSRMVKDEYVRTVRGESTRFSESPNDTPKPPFGDGSTSSSSSTPTVNSVPNGTDGKPSDALKKSPEEMAKADLWRAAVSVLEQGGCPKPQCRTFMGKLVGDYTFPIVQQAVAVAVSAQPADAREYLKATCQRLSGERQPVNKQEALEQRGQNVVDEWATQGVIDAAA